MPSSTNGQKRISSLELQYVAMNEKLLNIEQKMDIIGTKLDTMIVDLEPWRISVHDNTKEVIQIRKETAEFYQDLEGMDKCLQGIKEEIKEFKVSVRIYGAIGGGVLSFLIPIIYMVIQNFVDKL